MKSIITSSFILIAGLSFGQSKSKETNISHSKQNTNQSNTHPKSVIVTPTTDAHPSASVTTDTNASNKPLNTKKDSTVNQPKSPAKKNPNPYILPK
ncbi:MAG TPA: hypothetical protein VFL70_03995 [Bacteroidia bacterium]|nr:hypothetical protein [Bacteroidia bacterium]